MSTPCLTVFIRDVIPCTICINEEFLIMVQVPIELVAGASATGVAYGLYRAVEYHGQLKVMRSNNWINIDEVEGYEKSSSAIDALRQDVEDAE